MMLRGGTFQIKGMGLSRVMPGGVCAVAYSLARLWVCAGETPPLQPAGRRRYVATAPHLSGAGLRLAFVLCCAKLLLSRTSRAA